jgi:hypothetical protein
VVEEVHRSGGLDAPGEVPEAALDPGALHLDVEGGLLGLEALQNVVQVVTGPMTSKPLVLATSSKFSAICMGP